jgi:hypothetical protein
MPFVDDQNIANDVLLLRVLRYPDWSYPKEQPTRPSSLAFFDSNGENSCFIAAETDFQRLEARFPNLLFGSITAGLARECGYYVARDDDGADGMPGHVIVGYPLTPTNLPQYRKAAGRLAGSGGIYRRIS